ncbi:replication initiator [Aeromicrobium terrae]|uniref:Replication initiation protein n=1 Tax=Aeromicrobium terrae TaxID=2498846 RepID=A0A5C8NM63_9ACTN|nr:replication initiator [Aeromicrobium terrae]TXL62352.1 replication initiation protein [Aeromicrobium terrae]
MDSAVKRGMGCARPVRLRGRKEVVHKATGESATVYDSGDEVDGQTYVRCGDRRASVCPSCSHEYKGDAWHLLMCGLAGGKGIPANVAAWPCTFATLTAPSFGPVHGIRGKGPCRMRRDKPACTHGRPLWCGKRHRDDDSQVGQPLCWECYDYVGQVLWQWYAPELWRRFSIGLQRELAKQVGLTMPAFRKACRISYSKVVEFQARAAIHVHAPIRLDGADGPDGLPCALDLSTADLEDAIQTAAANVRVDAEPLRDGTVVRLRWGSQIDTRTIVDTADRESGRVGRVVHPEQVAAYLAKYLTKSTEDFGLPNRVRSVLHARRAGASPHALRIIETAIRLSREHESYGRLASCLGTLGYRGHPITKSRRYSVTFEQLRRSRRVFRSKPAGLDPDADIRELLDDDPPEGFEVVSSFVYVGRGYLGLDQAAAAVRSAALARAR